MRKTKIVATMGPATDSPEIIRAMLMAGMDVARFNFSHGMHDEIVGRVAALRSACEETGRPVALLADRKSTRLNSSH